MSALISNSFPAFFHPATLKKPPPIRFAQSGKKSDWRIPIPIDDDSAIRRKVIIGNTGGTFGMALSEDGTRTLRSSTRDSLEASVFDSPVDSSDINRPLQQNILRWVYSVFGLHKEATPGIVLTHGTDTMEESGQLLAYQNLPMVIVLTGSWSSPGEKGSDAARNMLRAKRAAEVIPVDGVYAVIQDQIILASQLHKVQNSPRRPPQFTYQNAKIQSDPNKNRYNYFASIHDEVFGRFDENDTLTLNPDMVRKQQAHWDALPESNKAAFSNISPSKIPQPAYVEHLIFTKNTPYRAFYDLERRLASKAAPNGAILEGDWPKRRNASDIADEIKELKEQQHYIISTENTTKQITPYFATDTLPAFSLRAKLAALLSQNKNPFELAQLSENISGEIIPGTPPVTQPLKVPQAFEEKGEIVIAHPALTPKVITDAVERLKTLPTQKPVLLLVGYGDGHLPIGDTTDCFIELEKYRNGKATKQDVRQWLIANRPMLAEIAKAVDAGIDVRMGSKGEYLAPHLGAYEIGAILKFIGVKPTRDKYGHVCTTQKYLNRFTEYDQQERLVS